MKRHKIAPSLLLCVVLLAGVVTAFAQTAQVTGRVSDAGGAVVPGAQVTLTNQATGSKRETVANDEGYYTVPLLPPGTYEINVSASGFRSVVQTGAVLNVEQAARLDFTLQPGAVNETINITSDAPLLNRETSSVGQVIDNKTVVASASRGKRPTRPSCAAAAGFFMEGLVSMQSAKRRRPARPSF